MESEAFLAFLNKFSVTLKLEEFELLIRIEGFVTF